MSKQATGRHRRIFAVRDRWSSASISGHDCSLV